MTFRARPIVALVLLLPGLALAKESKHQRIELGPARTQRSLTFYTELPESRREAERLPQHRLPCGTPVTPLAYQVLRDGDDTLAFFSFIAPHTSGHLLIDRAHAQQANLVDYFLFDPEGTPFCLSAIDQTLTQCGAVGVTLRYTEQSVLEAEIENLSSDQVLFVDWAATRLMSEGGTAPVLPSDLFLRLLESELHGPLANLSLVGLGTHAGLKGYAPETTEEDLEALWELSKRVSIDRTGLLHEPLGPGQKRRAPLSVFVEGGWKTANLFLPTSRRSRHTLSLPIGRAPLARRERPEEQTPRPAAPASTIVPQGPLNDGPLQLLPQRPMNVEACTIGFTIE